MRSTLFTCAVDAHGRGEVKISWSPSGNWLATCGRNNIVNIWTRYGDRHDEVALRGACSGLYWDSSGTSLAVRQTGMASVPVWDGHTRKVMWIETGFKDVTWAGWSQNGAQLALGGSKGELTLFNQQTRRTVPIIGKHSKRITSGCWNNKDKLALVSDDHTVSISNADGDTLLTSRPQVQTFDLRDASFNSMKQDTRDTEEQTLSLNSCGRTLLLMQLETFQSPIELQFQSHYGELVGYQWFGDGYIMAAFATGHLAAVSTHMGEISVEQFAHRVHNTFLSGFAYCPKLSKAATCGDVGVKVIDLSDWKDLQFESLQLPRKDMSAASIEWSPDGQVLTVACTDGNVINYLMCLPALTASCQSRLVKMTSLRGLSVEDYRTPGMAAVSIPIEAEPGILACGPMHVAAGINNHVDFYAAVPQHTSLVQRCDYITTVDAIQLSATHAAVLSGGRVRLHPIELVSGADARTMTFPEDDSTGADAGDGAIALDAGAGERGVLTSEQAVTSIAMTPAFLIYATKRGDISYFSLADWQTVGTYRHTIGVSSIWANTTGTRVLVHDETGTGMLYNPVTDEMLRVPGYPATARRTLWDCVDVNEFVVDTPNTYQSFAVQPHSLSGAVVQEAGTTCHPGTQNGVLLVSGRIIGHVEADGMLVTTLLHSHNSLRVTEDLSASVLTKCFQQHLALGRLDGAWEVALDLNSEEIWRNLATAAMRQLDVPLAKRCFRCLRDAGMVQALQDLDGIEETNLLAGYLAMLLGDYSRAQELLLLSTQPVTALEMRRDLFDWEASLTLADRLAPDQIPAISRAHAQQLEFSGDYSQALQMYEKSLQVVAGVQLSVQDRDASEQGVARCALRLGDVGRGLQVVDRSTDTRFLRDSAQILENLKQHQEAARLYVRCKMYERAVAIYLSTKNFAAAMPLMKHIDNLKLHATYAKAREAEGAFEEAERAYQHAKDFENVVRLNLHQLGNPQKAFDMVRTSKNPDSARLVSKFCRQVNDYKAAMEFLMIANAQEEAFKLAQTFNEVETYAQLLGEKGTGDDYLAIAQHYESVDQVGEAGRYYLLCGQHAKALTLFLAGGERYLDQAIKVVGQAGDDRLTHQLIDYLMGETDGITKDPNYIFRLYMALGNYVQAAKTAVIIAKQEQELGNYKHAHEVLYEIHRDLMQHKIPVPQELSRALMLLHSYVLVKVLVKQQDHAAAARMLIRVANSISKFPSHVVPILTSTVIECQRAGLKRSAFEFASMLMLPQYRSQIAPAYKRKIESVVRRHNRDEAAAEADEPSQPCPFCQDDLPITQLACGNCKNTVPFCIATGTHMVQDDCTRCDSCSFPAKASAMQALRQTPDLAVCPMCAAALAEQSLAPVPEARDYLRGFANASST